MTYHPACTKCGWKFPGFHICLNLSDAEMKKPEIKVPKHIGKGANREQNRWVQDRLEKEGRDEDIVRFYKEGLTVQDTARKVGVSKPVAHRVLTEAVERGELVMRKRGGQVKRKDWRGVAPAS